ncbi:nucleoside 2-deoxyribosyltransferase [Lacticaseibacillus nasuensis]|uniref:nucleoside 2-deoxyribosyltransferase n=1 Tax=Lacticaseibacillus nasuensis TaxID=944671 RepID=UPI002246623A|nr:nucleoside 2-deoxyribosyltransferase [Lacticaseibacillus nasuensis]MCX2456026.1 nucleoside 2-deoxyribosyltransferase [Lacticaseibacillus nasuensis]
MAKAESIYIAGPECFFDNGNEVLKSMRVLAESHGHTVTLPNDDPLKMDNKDLRLNAESIFNNLEKVMAETSLIIADLDQFRGAEPDSGTVFEIGMAYARGIRTYGFARDTRPLVWKDQRLTKTSTAVFDEHGWLHQYTFLPFSPLIMATTKVVEGTFEDALVQAELDNYQLNPSSTATQTLSELTRRPRVFVALMNYYDPQVQQKARSELSALQRAGYELSFPYFEAFDGNETVSVWLNKLLTENQRRVDEADIFVAELNNLRGYESANDVGFLSGYAFERGKQLFGFMADTRPMIEKIPNTLRDGKYKDIADRDVENFNYPINLMFACSMKISEGGLTEWQQDFLQQTKAVSE